MSRDRIATARTRLAIQFALVCATLLGASGGAVYAYVRQSLHGAFDAAHDLAIRSVRETLDETPAGFVVRHSEFQEELDELRTTLGVVEASVWSAEGAKLAESAVHGWSSGTASLTGSDREVRETSTGLVVIRRERVVPGGVVVVTRDATGLERDLAAFARGLIVFIPVAILASLAVGWWMAGRTLRPVRRVIEQQHAFMADASHELRTPLAVIQTHAEVGASGEADVAALRASLGVVASTASQLGVLVGDLMYLSRSDASALEPKRVRVDVEDLLEETIEGYLPMAQRKGSRIRLTCPAVEVTADPFQLRRLVTILVDNAVRHANPGDIDVSLAAKGDTVELLVEDQGPGIGEDLLPRVFERFVRGDRARQHDGGHGLGLAIAQSIVTAHRGRLTLQRNERGGTTACVVVPAAETLMAQPPARRHTRQLLPDLTRGPFAAALASVLALASTMPPRRRRLRVGVPSRRVAVDLEP